MSRCRQVASRPCRKRPPAVVVVLYTDFPSRGYTRSVEAEAVRRAAGWCRCGRHSIDSTAAGTAAVAFGSCTAATAADTAAVVARIYWGRLSRVAREPAE